MGATQQPSLGERFVRAARVFLDPRVLIILLLGFSSGLPLALSGSTLLLWMKDVGVDLGTSKSLDGSLVSHVNLSVGARTSGKPAAAPGRVSAA